MQMWYACTSIRARAAETALFQSSNLLGLTGDLVFPHPLLRELELSNCALLAHRRPFDNFITLSLAPHCLSGRPLATLHFLFDKSR